MSDPQASAKATTTSTTVLVVAATVIFVVTIGAITAMALAIDDGARATTMIGLLATPLTMCIGFLALFVKSEATAKTLATVQRQTTELSNGVGDAKIRAAVADVLPDHLIDPAAVEQITKDRARRTAAAEAAAALVEPHVFPEREGL